MSAKTTRVICNSQDPESRPAVQLSPLAIEDLTDTPVYSLTSAALQELEETTPQTITLTPHLMSCLEAFTKARRDREAAAKGDLDKYIRIEDTAALTLAWAFEQAVNGESAS